MLFPSKIFLFLFLPLVLFGYYVLFRKSRRLQNYFLTVASLAFYAYGEPKFVLIMLASIAVNWFCALQIARSRVVIPPEIPVKSNQKARFFLILSLVINLLILFIFKYLTFTLTTVNSLVVLPFSVPHILLPLGISFFTFQALSYVVDVYRGDAEVQKSPMAVALYIALFPQLIAGPIVRYQTIADQIVSRKETLEKFSSGFCRFVFGLAKKTIIANNLAFVADYAFDDATSLTIGLAWLGSIAYTLQIYYDFSAYSDMAIGLGKMFGFEFLENFNYPYVSKSLTEFWRRWHISLGTWFRDYVYFPLGGSRVATRRRLIFNLFVVWLLTGVWHGANWTFICWGLFYFVMLTLERMTKFNQLLKFGLDHVYALFCINLGMTVFRASSLNDAWRYIGVMFGCGNEGIWNDWTTFFWNENRYFFLMGILFATPVLPYFAKRFEKFGMLSTICYPPIILFLLIISLSYVINNAYSPFIYFNF